MNPFQTVNVPQAGAPAPAPAPAQMPQQPVNPTMQQQTGGGVSTAVHLPPVQTPPVTDINGTPHTPTPAPFSHQPAGPQVEFSSVPPGGLPTQVTTQGGLAHGNLQYNHLQHQFNQNQANTAPTPSPPPSSPTLPLQPGPAQITPGQQVTAPQRPAMTPPPAVDYGDANPELVAKLEREAQQQNIPPNEIPSYVGSSLDNMSNFETVEEYQEYIGKFSLLQEALQERYGNDTPAVLDEIKENIRDHGGDALVDRFMSDPAMLDPEIVMPYLGEMGDGGGNPYKDYLQLDGSMGRSVGPGQAGAGGSPMAGADLATIDNEIKAHYSPQNQQAQGTDEWNARSLQLFNARKAAMVQASTGNFI